MITEITVISFVLLSGMSSVSFTQTLDGSPYTPGKDPDIDLYMNSWKNSMPRNTHGTLVERDILTPGDPMNPQAKGAVLSYVKRFVYATLAAHNPTQPTTLKGEQEIFFILSGKGVMKARGKTTDLYAGIAVLMPANLEFTMENTGDEPLTMYIIREPIPDGFSPNKDILVKDENTLPIASTTGHWCHIVKNLFNSDEGLATLQSVLTVAIDPMTIPHPHSHVEKTEEVWTAVTGTSIAFIGKQIRWQEPGTGYKVPPNGNTPHSNINTSDRQVKIFYFSRLREK